MYNFSGKVFGKITIKEVVGFNEIFPVYKGICECGEDSLYRYEQLINEEICCSKCIVNLHGIQFKLKDNYVIGETLSKEQFFVDIEDYEKIKKGNISINHGGYVVLYSKGKRKLLHRLLMSPQDNEVVDHINRNRADNRKSNLRICSQSENMKNVSLRKNNKSGYTGVMQTSDGRWGVTITVDGKRINLGTFKDIKRAAKVRRRAEIEYFGDFAPFMKEEMDLSYDHIETEEESVFKADISFLMDNEDEDSYFKVPKNVIRNEGFDLTGDEFILYLMLAKFADISGHAKIMVLKSDDIKTAMKIADNRSLKNKINKLYKNNLITEELMQIPRNGEINISFNYNIFDQFKCIDVSSWTFNFYIKRKLKANHLRILLYNLTLVKNRDTFFTFELYSVLIDKLKISGSLIVEAKRELLKYKLIKEKEVDESLDELYRGNDYLFKNGLFLNATVKEDITKK